MGRWVMHSLNRTVLLITLFLAYRIWEFLAFPPYFMRNYFEDLLALPIILGIALVFQRSVTYRDNNHILSNFQIGSTAVLVAIVFELILPFNYSNYYADWLDVLCYTLGALFFKVFVNVKPTH